MIRLILGDLIDNLRIWLGAALIAAVAAVVGAIVASDIQTATQVGGTAGLALYGISGTVILFSAVTSVVVLGSITNLAVALHQRSYALWQLVGLGPQQVRRVVKAQLALMALIGGAAGCAAAVPLLRPLFAFCFANVPQLRDITPAFSPVAVGAVIAYVLVTVLLGGSRGARRAAQIPAIQALREPEAPTKGMSTTRWLTGAALFLILVSIVVSLPGAEPEKAATSLMLIGPLTAGLLSALSPVFMVALLRRWTAVLPLPLPGWWHLARQAAAHHASQSTAVIIPLVMAVSLVGCLYASQGTAPGGDTFSIGGVVLLLGGPILLSLTGATVTLFMAGRQRDREVALLLVSGGTTATIVAAVVSEAVIYVTTAVLLAVPTVLATGLVGAWALDVPPVFGLGAVSTVVVASLVLITTAAVVPALLALRKNTVRTLAAE
ncbi:ABC transporter permease [Streptomyces enissocaesilis]|uniref:ABC3 transporter permease C-terminal domain-containing protein n=1 Tax=Streptomyces enissocaesilis TaxID=332589 RepID=A0ABP6K4V0_9ACTN